MAERLLADAPERFALIGLSMGGYVALEVLRRAPERVRAVGLISTSARPDTPAQGAVRREQAAIAQAGRLDEIVESIFPILVDDGVEHDRELRAVWRSMAAEVGAEVFCTQQQAIGARIDSRGLLAAIACPAAVIHGAGDRLLAVEHGEELAAGIPGAQTTIIVRCGHMSALEQPAAVAAALGSLLSAAV